MAQKGPKNRRVEEEEEAKELTQQHRCHLSADLQLEAGAPKQSRKGKCQGVMRKVESRRGNADRGASPSAFMVCEKLFEAGVQAGQAKKLKGVEEQESHSELGKAVARWQFFMAMSLV